MPVISVILPTRDRPQLLGRALASVLGQQDVDFEVIVIDNNQSAPAVAGQNELRDFINDPRVRLVRAKGARNASAVRNAGLAVAQGEWISFLDDDDEYAPDKLSRQLALARETNAPLVLCGYEVRLGRRRRTIQCRASLFLGNELLLDAVWGTPFLFMRRDPALRFDENLESAEDVSFAQTYLRRNLVARVPCVPEPLVIVHPQPGPRVNDRHEAHWQAMSSMLEIHGSRYSSAARRQFLLRAELQRHKGAGSSWRSLFTAGCRLIRSGGKAEVRRVGNAWLYRSGWFRRWLVS